MAACCRRCHGAPSSSVAAHATRAEHCRIWPRAARAGGPPQVIPRQAGPLAAQKRTGFFRWTRLVARVRRPPMHQATPAGPLRSTVAVAGPAEPAPSAAALSSARLHASTETSLATQVISASPGPRTDLVTPPTGVPRLPGIPGRTLAAAVAALTPVEASESPYQRRGCLQLGRDNPCTSLTYVSPRTCTVCRTANRGL